MDDSTNCTITYDCPNRNICSDNGVKCAACANNPKRSYYRPIEPYIPYVPYYPPYYTGDPPDCWRYTTISSYLGER